MNTRSLARAIPGLVVVAVFALAATAPRPNIVGAAPPPQLHPACDVFASDVPGDSSVGIMNGGLEQALPPGMTVAACSLGIISKYGSSGRVYIREWDPTTLAPDPDAIQLRTFFFDGSSLQFRGNRVPRVSFVPPVVLASVPGVAEPPKPQIAIQAAGGTWYPDTTLLRMYFTPDGPANY